MSRLGGVLFIVASVACTTAMPSATSSPRPSPTSSPSPTSPPSPSASPSASPAPIELVKASLARAAGTDADAHDAARAMNAFAFDLDRLLAEGNANYVFSPASIAIALGMARTGARGDTATQMDAVLREVASDDHASWLNALDQALAARNGSFADDEGTMHELVLEIANSYFAQRGFTFEAAFLDALAERYGAGMHVVDFKADPDGARRLINEWGAEQTRGRIPEVLRPPDVTSDTRLALVNAIYLKAPWFRPFDEERTTTEDFHRTDGSTVEVPMMHSFTGVRCTTADNWGAFEIPYVAQKLAMLVVVPDDLEAFEEGFGSETFDRIETMLDAEFAVPVVSLPRFKVETREELSGRLTGMGMPSAFDPTRADFSGVTGDEPLHIGKVIHQANISVDEKGTEAAAVTVVGMDTGGGPTDECVVSASRPFIYAVRDTETGAILFMGRVVDPTAG